ncbi:MAG: uracil-DNA glycosylase [Rubrivivax sp.]|nr:uracil-DNA glycosylase [Rubrivivax sp.]
MNRLRRPLAAVIDEAALHDWTDLVRAWAGSRAGQALIQAVDDRVAAGAVVYPGRVLRALELTPLAATRVVILGQDPYHGPDQAEGLAFSVPAGVRIPPSLRNVHQELRRDLGLAAPGSGSLLRWCAQGVLLLNASLTVEAGAAGSHARLGWGALTGALVGAAARDPRPKVFMLWGAQAQSHGPAIASLGPAHCVLRANHPSPLSALRGPTPFIGCGHFGQARRWLAQAGRGELDWALA